METDAGHRAREGHDRRQRLWRVVQKVETPNSATATTPTSFQPLSNAASPIKESLKKETSQIGSAEGHKYWLRTFRILPLILIKGWFNRLRDFFFHLFD